MKLTTHKLLSTAAAACLLFGTTTRVFAQSEFAGSLNTVSISDAAGANKPPTASFTYTQVGDTFTFDASGSFDSDGSVVDYKWVFGDNLTGSGSEIIHTYSLQSAFPVTLTLVDNAGGVTILGKIINTNNNSFIVSDDFNRTNGAVGSPWVTAASSGVFTVTSNKLRQTAGLLNSIVVYDETFDSEHYSQSRRVTGAAVPGVRFSTSSKTGYYFECNGTGAYMRKIVNGTVSNVGSSKGGLSCGEGVVLKLEVDDTNTLYGYTAGTLVMTRTDSTDPITTGKPGVYYYNTAAIADDFVAGDL